MAFPRIQAGSGLKRILFKFNIPKDVYVDGDLPVFTVNVFDSTNKTLADMESANDGYFEKSTPFMTSVFRSNRYFLGRGYVSDNDNDVFYGH